MKTKFYDQVSLCQYNFTIRFPCVSWRYAQ